MSTNTENNNIADDTGNRLFQQCNINKTCHIACFDLLVLTVANRTASVDKFRRKSATMEDPGGGSSSLDDSEDGADGVSARERLKARFLAELRERRRHEQTARQLQRNYDDLLRSHAEKELTIEQLRLGARVSLTLDPPVPGRAVTGTIPGAQRAIVFSVPKAGVATTTSISMATLQSTSTNSNSLYHCVIT